MLYYILPPIIIIVSLSILIYYLFRKVSDVPRGELAFLEEKRSLFSFRRVGIIFPLMGGLFLRFLEKIIQRSKLLSLKFHNLTSKWSHSIRKRREQSKPSPSLAVSVEEEKVAPANIKKERPVKVDEIREKKKFSILSFKRAGRKERYGVVDGKVVSEEVSEVEEVDVDMTSAPSSIKRGKNELEEVLIKRIAVNPKDIEAYERLGEYYVDCGSGDDALECYRQVLRLSPGQFKAKAKLRAIERALRK